MEGAKSKFASSVSGDGTIDSDSDLDIDNSTFQDTERNPEIALTSDHLEATLPDSSHSHEGASQNIYHTGTCDQDDDSVYESSIHSTLSEGLGIIATSGVESEACDNSVHEVTSSCSKNNHTIEVPARNKDRRHDIENNTAHNVADPTDNGYSHSNPFNDDDLDDETPGPVLNPFNDDSENHDTSTSVTDDVASMNPFGDDSVESSPKGGNRKERLRQNLRHEHKSPRNPFDDGDTEEGERIQVKEVPQQRKVVTALVSSTIPASQLTKTRAKPVPVTQSEVPERTFSKEYNELITLGFDKICAGHALQKSSGDLHNARKILTSKLFDDRVIANEEVYVWKSPVMIRVGGWLPNVQDEAGSIHTSYFINVTMTLGNESWRVGHRYSEFYSLYSSIYNQLGKAFPSGMHDMFPTDRLSNWLSSANQETINDKRRKALDSWLREVCNSPHMMLDEVTRKSIFSFFQVDENMTARGKSSSQKAESAGSVKTSTQCPPPSKNPLSLLKSFSRRSEGSTTPAAQDTPNANSTNAEFDNRKRAALAAQRNDYSSVQSERELRQQSNETEVHLRSSEPSSSGFTDVRSKSFARRVNQQN